MHERNPYAPPKADIGTVRNSSCQRDGKFVVLQAGSDLPARCIVCNEPTAQPVKEVKLYWHSPWFYLLILINFLVYLVVGLIARKTVKVSPGMCAMHASKRLRRILMFVGAGGAAIALAVFLMMENEADGAMALFFIAILLLIIGMLSSRKVYAKEITEAHARIGGCKEPFLASLE